MQFRYFNAKNRLYMPSSERMKKYQAKIWNSSDGAHLRETMFLKEKRKNAPTIFFSKKTQFILIASDFVLKQLKTNFYNFYKKLFACNLVMKIS